jgi:hypothetical protein
MKRLPLTIERIKSRTYIDKSGCWIWEGSCIPRGYGMIRFNGGSILVHRAMWMLTHGKIPKGMNVCHRCDVRACVNPEHLFTGNQKENMLDCNRKGRNGKNKLTIAMIKEIRSVAGYGHRSGIMSSLAKRFGVSGSTISLVYHGKRQQWAK